MLIELCLRAWVSDDASVWTAFLAPEPKDFVVEVVELSTLFLELREHH